MLVRTFFLDAFLVGKALDGLMPAEGDIWLKKFCKYNWLFCLAIALLTLC